MNKIVAYLLASAMMLALSACGVAPAPVESTPIVATVDAPASEEISNQFTESFGNPDDAIDWYLPVQKIEVKDGYTRFAVVTVANYTDEQVDQIGNAVFGNYAQDYNLASVRVVNEAGTELFSRRS